MKEKILFVINPVSGDVDKSDLIDEIIRFSKKHQLEYHIHKTAGNEDRIKISEAIRNQHPDTVVVAGGDGTVNMVATLLTKKDIPLGIIPMGSANGLAYELGIPQQTKEALEVIQEGKTMQVDAVKINNSLLFFHLGDMGMNARIIKRFEKEGTRGLWGYFKQFLKEFRHIKKFRVLVETADETIQMKTAMVVIANGSYYGTGANINPIGSPNDGKFEVILFKRYPSWYIFRLVIAFFSGKLHKEEYVKIISVEKARISVSPIQDLQIDGELMEKTESTTIEIIPAAVQVIYQPK